MESATEHPRPGELVRVAQGSRQLDAIVFDTPSRSKVVVAVVDPRRGPVFRTVAPKTVTERTEESPHDAALRLLMRRTPPPIHGAARDGGRRGRGQQGYMRAAPHRTTSK